MTPKTSGMGTGVVQELHVRRADLFHCRPILTRVTSLPISQKAPALILQFKSSPSFDVVHPSVQGISTLQFVL